MYRASAMYWVPQRKRKVGTPQACLQGAYIPERVQRQMNKCGRQGRESGFYENSWVEKLGETWVFDGRAGV